MICCAKDEPPKLRKKRKKRRLLHPCIWHFLKHFLKKMGALWTWNSHRSTDWFWNLFAKIDMQHTYFHFTLNGCIVCKKLNQIVRDISDQISNLHAAEQCSVIKLIKTRKIATNYWYLWLLWINLIIHIMYRMKETRGIIILIYNCTECLFQCCIFCVI